MEEVSIKSNGRYLRRHLIKGAHAAWPGIQNSLPTLKDSQMIVLDAYFFPYSTGYFTSAFAGNP